MKTQLMKRSRKIGLMVAALMTMTLATAPGLLEAKGGSSNRVIWRGIVQAKPAGLIGSWTVGGRSFLTTRNTEFDQVDGILKVGACAKVDVRDGSVHEVDSEPLRDC